jgi:hypothetical protein
MNTEHESRIFRMLPTVLEHLGDEVSLDDVTFWDRVRRRRRARSWRRATAALAGLVIAVGIAAGGFALTGRDKAGLRVATAGVSTTTHARPDLRDATPFADLALAPGCAAPPASVPFPSGLDVGFRASESTIASSEAFTGEMTLTNSTPTVLAVETSWPTVYAASDGAIVGVGYAGPDPNEPMLLIGREQEVPADGTSSLGVTALITGCAKSLGAGAPLPAGSYDVYVSVPSGIHESTVMVAAPVTVTLT